MTATFTHKVAKGCHWVRTLHPYDLAEYHWAYSPDGKAWGVYRDQGMGLQYRCILVDTLRTGDASEVAERLRELNKGVLSHIDRT